MRLMGLILMSACLMAWTDQVFEYKGAKIHWVEFDQGELSLVMDPHRRQKLSDVANEFSHSVVMNGSFFFTNGAGHQPTYYLEKEGVPMSVSRAKQGALGWDQSKTVWDVISPKGQTVMKYQPRRTPEHIWQSVSHIVMGVPLLIDKGAIMPVVNHAGAFYQLPYARSVVAQKDNGHLVFVVVETGLMGQIWMKLWGQWPIGVPGRGLSLYDLATWLKQQGVRDALNLDGGGSVGLAIDGNVLVKPRFKWQNLESERGLSHFLVMSRQKALS